jgi:DNA repair exonuclease SbcCD ATPase subunit
MNSSEPKFITIFLSILFLLATFLGIYSWKQKNSLELTNKSLITKVDDLTTTHDDLLADIEKLENDLEELLSTNEKQKKDLEEANNTIAKNKKELAALRKKYAKDIGWMKAEIKDLRAAKKELTDLVAQLKKEKASGTDSTLLDSRLAEIETRKKELEEELAKVKEENNALRRDNKTLDVTAIRATNTRVDLFKKGYKPTTSFKRTREIVVSFNLSHLASTKQGVHDLT